MDKNKKDYLTKTLGIQTLICVIMFGALFALKQTESNFFTEIKDAFSDKLSEQITKDDVKDVFSSLNKDKNEKTDENTEIADNYEPLPEPSLNAEITAEGGADISVSSKDEIPDNVSVEKYSLNQKMIMPVRNGNITSKFGIRVHPISNDLRFHAGTDIAADEGSPIYAAFDGTVTAADYDQWNGNYIKIKHDNGIGTVYCHCKKLNVKKGDKIRAGEIIGFVGSTGNSTGPHLHFELRINNISYNPEYALKEAINEV